MTFSAVFIVVVTVSLCELCIIPTAYGQPSDPQPENPLPSELPQLAMLTQCSFPAFLTLRPMWETRISLSRGVIGKIWSFGDTAAQESNVVDSSVMLYSCFDSTSIDANTVLVRVASTTTSSYNDLSQPNLVSARNAMGYQCLRFVQRSQYVVQVWKSVVSNTVTPPGRLCDQLVLDQFPLVYTSLDGENSNTPTSQLVPTDGNNVGGTGCAISGGYTFTLQPSDANANDTGSQLCAEIPLRPIMESDCGCTEGQPSISIDFRQWFCAGELGMPLTSTVYCIGSWSDPASNYVFSLVADASTTRSKLWMFRWPLSVAGRRAFIGHVSTEISTAVDDRMTPLTSVDVSYAVYMTPTSYSEGLCNNEAPLSCNSAVCTSNDTADDFLSGLHLTETSCQQTCGTCVKDSGNFSSCMLAGSSLWLVGSWSEASSNIKRQRTVTVGTQSINFSGDNGATTTIANCVSFSTGSQSFDIGQRFPVATVYPSTGCRTRYACIELTQRSPSVMTYRVGRAVLWPYMPTMSFPSQLGANMLCSDSMFQTTTTEKYSRITAVPDVTYLDMSHDMRAVVKIPSAGSGLWPVSCGLPTNGWLLLNGQLSNGDQLSATIDQCATNVNQYSFRYTQSATGASENHQCLAAYVDSDTGDNYIITMKQTDGSDKYLCWLFQRRSLFGIPNQVFLTNASDCNANTGVRVRSKTYGGYIASFQMTMPPDTEMSTSLFGSALSVVRSCVTFSMPEIVTTTTTTVSTTQPTKTTTKTTTSASTSASTSSTVSPAVDVNPSRSSSSLPSSTTRDINQVLSTTTYPSAGQSTVYKTTSRTVTVFAVVVVTILTAVLSAGNLHSC